MPPKATEEPLRRFPATILKDADMSFSLAMALVFGIVVTVAWGSSTPRAADSGATYTTVQSQAAIR